MILSLLACTQTSTSKDSSSSGTQAISSVAMADGEYVDGFYRYHDTVTINAVAQYFPEYRVDDPQENWLYKWALDKMNIKFIVEGVPNHSIQERNTLMFASGDLPECLISWPLNNLADQMKYGDEEGQLIPISDYISPKLTPNLYRVMQEVDEIESRFPTLKGNIYMFPQPLQNPKYKTNMAYPGLWYNTKWFDAIGYENPPQTLDEFLEALRLIKKDDPGKLGKNLVPLGGSFNTNNFNFMTFLMNSFGFGLTYYEQMEAMRGGDYTEGELVIVPYDDAYFEYLKYMNTLYSEGLIDQDFYSLDFAQTNAKISSGYCGVLASWNMYSILDNWDEWKLLEPLTSEWNDTKRTWHVGLVDNGYYMFLTSKCKNPEAIMRFMDVAYDKEYGYLFFHGPKKGVDDTYGMFEGWHYAENGVTVLYTDVESGKYANKAEYVQNVGPFGMTGNVFDRRTDGSEVALYSNENPDGYTKLQTIEHWSKYLTTKYPGALFETEVSEKLSDISMVVGDYVKTETAKFITGARPITLEEFEKYRADLDSMGIQEYIRTQKEAFEKQYR